MRKRTYLVAAALLLGMLASIPSAARAQLVTRLGSPFYPCPPAIAVAPAPFYQPYGPVYYTPPVVTFGSWWDPDYRAIRYNRYFERYQEQPRIWGFTLR